MLDLGDIQADVVMGLQKDVENFILFKIVDKISFRALVKQHVIGRITSAEKAHYREMMIWRRQKLGQKTRERLEGLNVGFTKDGLTKLINIGWPEFDPAFERGAEHPDTIEALNDPPVSHWVCKFLSDRIDGLFLVTGHDRSFVTFHSNQLLSFLGSSIKVVCSEIGNTRPGAERKREHFGFLDGISQPGIRGLTTVRDPRRGPDEGLPGQDLLATVLTWCSGGLSRKCPSSVALSGSRRRGSGRILSCWRPGWSAVGKTAPQWNSRRGATTQYWAATRSATMISNMATTQSNADVPMPPIFGRYIRATTH